MRNISEKKSRRENPNTHFILNNFLLKFVPFEKSIMWKIWYSQTGHKWQYKAHALCVLDN